MSTLLNCMNSVKVCMANNHLQFNPEKTEVLISALAGVLPKMMESLGSLSYSVKCAFPNLGVHKPSVLINM